MNKHRQRILSILKYTILILFLIACLYPLMWLIINSFKTQDELFQNTWGLPKIWTLDNYKHAVIDGKIGIYFGNSILVSVISVLGTIVLSVMASYGVTRLRWKLSNLTLGIFLLGLMIPAYGSVIPLYSIFNKAGILNTYIAVIIPHITFALPTAIFILSGFFIAVPRELEEAAIIDGCTLIQAFRKVVTPVVVPGIVTIIVISFINIWNDLLFSQIFLTDKGKMPLPIGLTEFKGIYATDYVGMIAAIVITVIPVIIVYVILHDKIIDGMIAGAVKG